MTRKVELNASRALSRELDMSELDAVNGAGVVSILQNIVNKAICEASGGDYVQSAKSSVCMGPAS